MTRQHTFRQLHEAGCFVMPNPPDPGSARLLERLGFRALATTSSGFGWSIGLADATVTLDQAVAHFRAMVEAVDLPINADLRDGYAIDPDGVAANVTRVVETGVAGLSIEDSTGDPANPLFEFALATERVRAARRAIDATGSGVLLTGRCEGFIAGRPDLDETIRRLEAYSDAGAECLFAPGIRTRDQIVAIVNAVAPKPVNVLVGTDFATVEELAAMGVRRISVGGALSRVGWTAVLEAATEIIERGTFTGLASALPFSELNRPRRP